MSVDFKELIKRYHVENTDLSSNDEISHGSARGEIFPSQVVPVVVESGSKKLIHMKWGFSPSFANKLIINARGETVDKKPTFKAPFLYNRCLIPAQAFFEWEKRENKKIKTRISLADSDVFSMAGIYDQFLDSQQNPFYAFSILTIEARDNLKNIHDRMPVILSRASEDKWLDPEVEDSSKLKRLIKPFEGDFTISRER